MPYLEVGGILGTIAAVAAGLKYRSWKKSKEKW